MSLSDDADALLVAMDTHVKAAEDRRAYRASNDRQLSKQHRECLQAIRERIDALLVPPATVAQLKADFEALQARTDEMLHGSM